MTSSEFKRWLKKHGCSFEESRGKGGHITIIYRNKRTIMPFHGSKEMAKGTILGIIKQLGIEEK